MGPSGCGRLAAAAAVLLAGTALADDPTAAPLAARYPIALRVVLTSKTLRAIYGYDPVYSSGPPILGCDVPVGAQARDAWEAAARRGSGGGTDPARTLEVEVSVAAAEVEGSGGAFDAAVEHRVVLRDAAGNEVDGWGIVGRARIAGLSQEALREAFAVAAERAAGSFGAEIGRRPRAASFLAQQGIALPPAAAPASGAPPARAAAVPRRRVVGYLDAGGATVRASYGSSIALAVRAGISGEILFVQGNLLRWGYLIGRDQLDLPQAVDDGIEMLDAGIEAGILRRFGVAELRAGAGVESYSGTITLTDWMRTRTENVSSAAMSISAGVTVAAGAERLGMRWRAGVEGRLRVGGRLDSVLMGPGFEPAGPSLAVFLGAEIGGGSAR